MIGENHKAIHQYTLAMLNGSFHTLSNSICITLSVDSKSEHNYCQLPKLIRRSSYMLYESMVLSHSHQAFVSVSIKLLVAVTEELGMNSLTIWSLLVVTCLAAPMAFNILDHLDALDKMVPNRNCSMFGLPKSKKCLDKLKTELLSSDDKPLNGTHNRTNCFPLDPLRNCVEKALTDYCGDLTDKVAEDVMESAIKKMQNYSLCQDGSIASVICLPGN